jgi:hypothetical protein
VFYEIDLKVHGTIHFRDGSVANIEGCDMILIKCKSGGHKTLTGVYYIPRLTANIVSLGGSWRRWGTRSFWMVDSSDCGIQVSHNGETGVGARRPVWSRDAGDTWRQAVLSTSG